MKNLKKVNKKGGFTLIEILVVIGIIAVLAAIVIIAINPARQFAQARDSQRTSNVSALLNAIGQNLADNKGLFSCDEDGDGTIEPITDDALPTSPATFKNFGSGASYDIRECIVPAYIAEMPVDPSIGVNTCVTDDCDNTPDQNPDEEYNSNYTIERDSSTQRLTVCSTYDEPAIEGTDPICVTR